jgi:hypothetical protein
MHQTKPSSAPIIGLLTLTLALPGVALAYGDKDAIRDCESHIRSEYGVSDLRDAQSERLNDSEHHYKVQGQAKVDGDRHPWTCEVKNRHVTSAEYSGPKPKGLGGAEKLAIGAAAVAAAVAINEASKQGGEGHSGSGASGAAGLQDLVGARGSSGESQLESRGYTYVSGEKGGDSSYTNWRKGSHCVSVRTTNGHYDSIVDVGMADCEGGSAQGGSHQGGSHAGGGSAGAADLQDLVGARGAGGETELQSRGYNYVAGNKWSNGWHCVTVHTADGHYKSIVDTPMANCH